MKTIIKATALLVVGVTLGIWSAHRGIDRAGAVYAGAPWKTWSRDVVQRSPYADAHFMLSGKLPMPASQFIVYEATEDSNGDELDASCSYLLGGRIPAVRWWSIHAGTHPDSKSERIQQITSAKAIVEASGETRIIVAKDPSPGNWISPGEVSKFKLVFVLHDPSRRGGPFPSPDELPSVQRSAC